MSNALGRNGRALAAAWVLLWLLAVGVPSASAQQSTPAEWVIIYKTAPGSDDLLRLDSAALRYQLLQHLPMVLVRGPEGEVRAAASGPNIRSVTSNAFLELYLDRSVPAIGANRVWSDLGFTGRGVGVAVVDSGVNARHQDLPFGSKVLQNVDIRLSSADGSGAGRLLLVTEDVLDSDALGHGTHVASVVGGSGRASQGRYAGVARNASLVGIGGGDNPSIFWALGAFDWVLDQRERFNLKVVTASWGSKGAFDPEAPVNVATRILHEAGLIVIFAGGNGRPDQASLNAFSVAPWVVGVAATSDDRTLAEFSSRGIKGDPLYHPTIAAPGAQITAARDPTSLIGAGASPDPSGFYTTLSGTSQASAHVAGVAALMLEANDRLSPDDVRAILVRTARPMPGHEEYQVGAGLLDALEAVRLARR